jgi:ketosteroid isomerase-like protein
MSIRGSAPLLLALLLPLSAPSAGEEPPGPDAESRRVLEEIRAAERRMDPNVRNRDVEKWLDIVTADFNEFDNYYPFLLEGHDAHRATQGALDQYDKRPAPTHPGAKRISHIQLFGDVAVVSTSSVEKGDPVSGGAQQRRKFTMVWVKDGAGWKLAHCNCSWVSTTEGLAYPPW